METINKDQQSVDAGSHELLSLPDGVTVFNLTTHIDERGSLFEVYNPRWGWHHDPIVFGHIFTVRPGYVKGWGMHKLHEDRYCLLFGELQLVLYDDRKKSPTRGLVSVIEMSEYHRKLVNIPPGIWHAAKNVGFRDAAVLDTPTKPYDYQNPDKYRLPLDTKKIPYSFENFKGW
jgi:dTDP-4-dehydrorhamnose 3,5-epimerase